MNININYIKAITKWHWVWMRLSRVCVYEKEETKMMTTWTPNFKSWAELEQPLIKLRKGRLRRPNCKKNADNRGVMEFWEGGNSQIGWFDTQKAKAIGDLKESVMKC